MQRKTNGGNVNKKISALKAQRKSEDKDLGFTLIELLVVILIIAILAAVGIVALLGAISSGQESAAKTTLNQGNSEVAALKSENGGSLPEATTTPVATETETAAGALADSSKDVEFSSGEITGDPTNKVSIAVDDAAAGDFTIVTKSKNSRCFALVFTAADGTTKYKSTETTIDCDASTFDTADYTTFK